MATGPMQFGTDNNAGSSQTILRSDSDEATLKVQNEETTGPTGGGIEVTGGGLYGVTATSTGTDSLGVGIGVNGIAVPDGIGVKGKASGNGVGVRG